ncbi:hypothetical protein K402DRAFT_390535 [Aulographum hederae CBS 113979]|uniref:Histone deacetylase interacting domain-containing protein n=1 Tax=Aulographum hederae CBS 113979 TaxID=1176131 RepID=A0A6G1H942_9PEZI|nr:hypothetical protein K402DRAFT_390535 [Aulographum hederae CBS 113979]
MNPTRESWPPSQPSQTSPSGQGNPDPQNQSGRTPLSSFGPNTPSQQHIAPSQAPNQGSNVLPPPSAQHFPMNQHGASPLPPPSSIAQMQHSQHSPLTQPGHPPQPSAQDPAGPRPPSHQQSQGPPTYSLPSVSQAIQGQGHTPQPQGMTDRDREIREARDIETGDAHGGRDPQHLEQEMRDQQQREQLALQENHTGSLQIHQPVAVAPHARAGLLGASGQLGGTNPLSNPLGPGAGPTNPFSSHNSHMINDSGPRGQPPAHASQPAQLPQQALMMPFQVAPNSQSGAMGMGQGQQPILNDALSYLDQVKVQFSDQPQVYNQFLDIMKDFKSGAIDTPGVIQRVSTLFSGNPSLIQGFNTFLPPGYKIECGTEDDPSVIRVTTPMGTQMRSFGTQRPLSNPRDVNGAVTTETAFYDSASRAMPSNWQPAGSDRMYSPGGRAAAPFQMTSGHNDAGLSPEAQMQNQAAANAALVHQQEQRGVSQLQNAVSIANGGFPRQAMSSPPGGASTPLPLQTMNGVGSAPGGANVAMEKRGPVEFNHAISYVNKIKNRFANQPDIYKQFLEILQTYQRESKPIGDVYSQVTILFITAPDLLEDFKQFLPESAANAKAQQAARAAQESTVLSDTRGEPGYSAASAQAQQQMHHTPRADQPRLPPVGNFAPTPNATRENKRKRSERQGTAASSSAMPPSMPQDAGPIASRQAFGQSNNKKLKQMSASKQPGTAEAPRVSPSLLPPLPPPPTKPTVETSETAPDLEFFQRVKKHIGHSNSTSEFVKLINLYNNDIITASTLVQQSYRFLGNNLTLLEQLKSYIRYDPADVEIEHKPKESTNGRVSLSNCRSLGPSYRLLPRRGKQAPCSGRDELCRSVLNDDWSSHPTWASEDSGFVAHRKNAHEERLHQVEEERHDYDLHIESLFRTIQLLEPIAQSLRTMSPADRNTFLLPQNLGGQSTTIHMRVLKKLYGQPSATEVNNDLFRNPYAVIPTVLVRMKSKLEEFKGARREWRKVWKDTQDKTLYKSLDHQSAGLKLDKRQYQLKTLVSEINAKFQEQKRQREMLQQPSPAYQLVRSFSDTDVLLDALQLIAVWSKHHQQTFNDQKHLMDFIKSFATTFFGLERDVLDARLDSYFTSSPRENSVDEEAAASDDAMSTRGGKGNSKKANFLRAVLDKRGGRPTASESVASESRASTPDVQSVADEDMNLPEGANADGSASAARRDTWANVIGDGVLLHQDQGDSSKEPFLASHSMYGNQSIYCFFRMLSMLYERLSNLKGMEDEVKHSVSVAMQPKPAMELGLVDKVPSDFFADTSETANYYRQAVNMFKSGLKPDAEIGPIEETLRRYYLRHGWQLYSFDKLVAALARFAMTVYSNDAKDRTPDIFQLFLKHRSRTKVEPKDELTYRKSVEKIIKDGDLFRISFHPSTMRAAVQISTKEEMSFVGPTIDQERIWEWYMTSYTDVDPTEGVTLDNGRYPMLRRSTEGYTDLDTSFSIFAAIQSHEEMITRISPDSFKLTHQPSTENAMSRPNWTESDRITEPDEAMDVSLKAGAALQKVVNPGRWVADKPEDAVEGIKKQFEEHIQGKKRHHDEAFAGDDDNDENSAEPLAKRTTPAREVSS